jgi:hypothetical protein
LRGGHRGCGLSRGSGCGGLGGSNDLVAVCRKAMLRSKDATC